MDINYLIYFNMAPQTENWHHIFSPINRAVSILILQGMQITFRVTLVAKTLSCITYVQKTQLIVALKCRLDFRIFPSSFYFTYRIFLVT